MPVTVSSQYLRVNNIDIYYEEYASANSKETIVLLHGFLSSSFSFRKLGQLLSNQFHVISVDLPPFGKSGKSTKFHYSYKNIATTVLQLLQQLKIYEYHLVGHSMGGQIVLNMILQRPNQIKKAVLLSSSGYMKRLKTSYILLSYIPLFDKYIKHHLNKTGVLGNLHQVVYDKKMIDDVMINGYAEPFLDNRIFKSLCKMIRDREGDLSSEQLQSISTPCLLIWGEFDKIVPIKVGKRLVNDLQNAQLVIFKNIGHLVPEETPMRTYDEIKKFILPI
nr:alpha/beta hydrolase [Paenibacillus bovis]